MHSPIEQQLVEALAPAFAASGVTVHVCAQHDPNPRDGLHASECKIFAPPDHRKGSPGVLVCSEAFEVGVDLLLRLVNVGRKATEGFDATIAVECDGHEYHERNKQQAAYDRARDRELLIKRGLITIRFTGSEIYRDANQCARECLEALLAVGALKVTR